MKHNFSAVFYQFNIPERAAPEQKHKDSKYRKRSEIKEWKNIEQIAK